MKQRQGGAAPVRGRPRAVVESARRRLRASSWVHGVVETLTVRFGLIIVGLGGSIVLARILAPEGRGELYLAMMLATLGATVLNFGFHSSNTYEVSRNPSLIGVVTWNSIVFAGVVGGAACLVTAGLAATDRIELPLHGWLLALVLASLPFQVAYLQVHPLLVVVNELRRFNALEIVQRASGLIVVAVLWSVDAVTPSSVFAGTTVILAASVVWVVARLLGASPNGKDEPRWEVFRRGSGFAGRAYVGSISGLLLLRVDVVLVDAELGPTAVGLYSIAASVGDLLQLVPATVGNLLFPRLSAMDDETAKWRLTTRAMLAVTIPMAAAALALGVIAPTAITFIYGSAYAGGSSALRWLLPGIVLLGINIILMNYLASIGMPKVTTIAPVVGLLLNIALNLTLIPSLGIEGAAVASTVSYAVMMLICAGWMAWHRPSLRVTPQSSSHHGI